MPPKLKICGLTRLEDARYCAAAGADYLGFIQYPGSPRYVPPETAKEIIGWTYGPEPVGVFVNAAPDEINRIADETGFALVQLHGDEPPEVCAQIERLVIKAIAVRPGATPESLRAAMAPYAPHVHYFLLDTHKAGLWGGTGVPFDWDAARALSDEFDFFVAGGIDAANVGEAVERLRPFGVDLSSSVESAPGVKDFDKLSDFFDAFRTL